MPVIVPEKGVIDRRASAPEGSRLGVGADLSSTALPCAGMTRIRFGGCDLSPGAKAVNSLDRAPLVTFET